MSQTATLQPSVTYANAALLGVAEALRSDERVVFLSTESPKVLVDEFGPERIVRTPISEAATTATALGAAACGLRPIIWWRNVSFSFVAMDQVINQASKLRYMSGGQIEFPIVMRAFIGGGLGLAAQHSQSPYAIFAHIPGIKVVAPATPTDLRGLLRSAVKDNNPVICLESYRCSAIEETIPPEDVDAATVPLGVGKVVREGTDVTLVAISYMLHETLAAAEKLGEAGISAEVIDPRTIAPLDYDLIRKSVQKTGRLVTVDEAPAQCSVGRDIAAVVAEHRERQDVAITCINGAEVPIPYSSALEKAAYPSVEGIQETVTRLVEGRA